MKISREYVEIKELDGMESYVIDSKSEGFDYACEYLIEKMDDMRTEYLKGSKKGGKAKDTQKVIEGMMRAYKLVKETRVRDKSTLGIRLKGPLEKECIIKLDSGDQSIYCQQYLPTKHNLKVWEEYSKVGKLKILDDLEPIMSGG
jgi:hypothetical protein